jgi:hypothetical protein
VGEVDLHLAKFLNDLEVLDPQQILLKGRIKRSTTPLPSGSRTNNADALMPKKVISFWRLLDIEFGP